MATTKKKKPAAPKKQVPSKKKATLRKPATAAAPAREVDDATVQALAQARANVERLSAELQAALGERDRLRGEVTAASDRHRVQSAELEKLRGETLKSATDLAAATRRTEEATRRADEAGRRVEEATRRADERERQRLHAARELEAARAELAGYKLRCPKCGKNFVEEEYEGITIDRCTGCDAIYFDAGEVDQLIARVHEKTTAPSADPRETSGWFRSLFKRKPKPGEPTGGESPPAE